jgi:hypothetical protein
LWIERTKSYSYIAPSGHILLADPTYQEFGQGRVRILNRNENSFDVDLTAIQGKFTVIFTTYEKWVHKSTTGEFEYHKSIFEYMSEVRNVIS